MFRLSRPFRAATWPAAVRELDRAAAGLAARLRGQVALRETETRGGLRFRSYRIEYEVKERELEQRLSFLLRGRREYQLLCRLTVPPNERSDQACDLLRDSFRPV